MDKITKQLISEFLESQEIESSDQAESFEKFCNYSILSREYSKTFDINSITIGAGSDTGIDGIAIIINGHLVEEEAEVDDLLESNGYLDVTYIFTQAKTSSNFDAKELQNFYFGIQDFFADEPQLPRNEDVQAYAALSSYILDKAPDFKENPKCKSYFCTTGIFNSDDKNISAVTKAAYKTLASLNLFESVEHNVLGANEIGKLYRRSKNPISATFNFVNKVTLPEIEGVEQSFYGVLPFAEFKKIIIDESGNLHSVFNDNVRDFQGNSNPVNRNIAQTLTEENPNLFCVLNNGVAIVAGSLKSSGNSFTISDYQIVNGCQTSNVLYECRNAPGMDEVNVPLRLIVTSDEEVKSQITVSTNNQTAVKKEQLAAMSDFQKSLEHYYTSITGDGKLYYERRAKQYSSARNIAKRRIITVPVQIKSFSSMFRKNPHFVTSFFGRLVKNIGEAGSRIFESDHQFATYYLAGLAYYRLDSLFNNGTLDAKYKKVRFFILMLVPLIASADDTPPLNSQRKVEKYCDPIIAKLNNPSKCKSIYKTAAKIIDKAGFDTLDNQAIKSKEFTDKIIAAYNGELVS